MPKCINCARLFKNAAGLSSHMRSCKLNSKVYTAEFMAKVSEEAEHHTLDQYVMSPVKLNASFTKHNTKIEPSIVPLIVPLIDNFTDEDIYTDEIELRPLKPCSEEQLAVVQAIRTHNVAVDAVAGSGKTTTCLHICKEYHDQSILILTYNAKLKLETKARFNMHNIGNASIHTYHSFVKKYYEPSGYTDSMIQDVITNNKQPLLGFAYQMIIIDEIQDLCPLYYELICKIYTDNNIAKRIVLFGDKNQCIYDFKFADERYLTMADRVFSYVEKQWVNKPMSCSFRITKQMANFVNICMLTNKRLIAHKEILDANKSPVKPLYIIYKPWAGTNKWIDNKYVLCDENKSEMLPYIKKYIKMGYKADDFLIVAPSIKSDGTPVRILANFITKYITNCPKDSPNYETYKKYPIFVPTGDDSLSPSERVIKGKILICTYHQAKGLERKVVFVVGFDYSYFKFFNKKANPLYCPNVLYVAATRALEHLILLHSDEMDYLPFLDKTQIKNYCTVAGGGLKLKDSPPKPLEYSVTKLLQHVSFNIVDQLTNKLTKISIRKKSKIIHVPNEIKQPYGYEEVNEITGTAIPAYLEFIIRGTCKIYEHLFDKKIFNNLKPVILDEYDEQCSGDEVEIFESKIMSNMLGDDDHNVCIDEDNDHNVCIDVVDNAVDMVDMKTFYDCFKTRESFYAMLASKDLLKPNKLLYCATRYCSYVSQYNFKNVQIKYHTWLSRENLDKCIMRCKGLNISSKSQFECSFACDIKVFRYDQHVDYTITGNADCIDDNNFYEFKCVKELKSEHFLQLAIYMYMHQAYIIEYYCKLHKLTCCLSKVPPEILTKYHYYLYNILTDEMVEIKCSFENLQALVTTLINEKNKEYPKCTDDEFIQRGLQITQQRYPATRQITQ